jgi:hypothetical protein
MKDAHKPLRTAIYEALNGNVVVNFNNDGSVVPIYDDEVTDRGQNVYVLLTTQTGTDASNRSHFNGSATQEIQIIDKTELSVDKRRVDDIADQVFEILWPTPQSDGLVQQTGFQILNLRKQADNYLPLQISSTQTLMRRIITFSARVHQL